MPDDPQTPPPTWATTMGQARKALTPPPPSVADLTDRELLAAYARALSDAGRIGHPTGDAEHDAALADLKARVATQSDAELERLEQAALDRVSWDELRKYLS